MVDWTYGKQIAALPAPAPGAPLLKHVFVTGASGCVGHYVVERLLARSDIHLHLLVRDPARLRLPAGLDRVTVLRGDMVDIADQAELLAEVDAVVHLATAWGDPIAYDVNVAATHEMMRLAGTGRCRRILYFSTASILDADNRPLHAADTLGTDYIRSKYLAYQGLDALPNREQVVTLFPTLVIGGGDGHPASHVSQGIEQALHHLWLLRHFRLDGTLHFIHAADIARMVEHLIEHPAPAKDLVLGNTALSVDAVLDAMCEHYGLPRDRTWDLTRLATAITGLAGSRMTSWDRYCFEQRHFQYHTVNPRSLGLPPGLETLASVLEARRGLASPGH